ncbi:MAG TPA: hypothetical protein VFV64_04565 [Permianibacter sp.]|nr:hypothetical protein [Permianibacter sp.]
MKVITSVTMAAVLWTVCDVSLAAQPATIKSIQPQPVALAQELGVDTAQIELVRSAGRDAQQAIMREALSQSAEQWRVQTAPVLLPFSDELVASVNGSGRQLAGK